MRRIIVILFLLMIQCVFDTGNASEISLNDAVEHVTKFTTRESYAKYVELLERILAVEDTDARTKLSGEFFDKSLLTPEETVLRASDSDSVFVFEKNIRLLRLASHSFAYGRSQTGIGQRIPRDMQSVKTAVRIAAQWINYCENTHQLAAAAHDNIKTSGEKKVRLSQIVTMAEKIETRFFKTEFYLFISGLYKKLPENERDDFVRLTKELFFHRKGFSHSQLRKFPVVFWDEETVNETFQNHNHSLQMMTLEEEIARHPKEWSASKFSGATTNHWNMLGRLQAVTNVQERIRLITAFRDRLREEPERLVGMSGTVEEIEVRLDFLNRCGNNLVRGKTGESEAVFAGWRILEQWLADTEKVIELSDKKIKILNENTNCSFRIEREDSKSYNKVWKKEVRIAKDQQSIYSGPARLTKDEEKLIRYAKVSSRIHWTVERYFRDPSFWGCLEYSLVLLPKDLHSQFVEQIKKDFFHRDGMKYVDRTKLPKEFQEEATR